MKNNEGIIISGGNFNATNVATGKDATIYHSQENSLDNDKLLDQISKLKSELKNRAQTPEEFKSLSKVAQAEQAIKNKDSDSVIANLKEAGKWVLDVAKEIGVDVITDMLKKSV